MESGLASQPQATAGFVSVDGALLLSGLPRNSQGRSPFHFGATPSLPVSAVEVRKLYPQISNPTTLINGKLVLPALDRPDIPSARGFWSRAIDDLSALPGCNEAALENARRHILDGVKLDFPGGPPPHASFKNTFTFSRHSVVCAERMHEYMVLGALRVASGPPPPGGYPYIQPLHAVVRPGKKPRIVVDMSRNCNEFLADAPFKYSSIQDAVDLSLLFPESPWYVKIDISSCFLSFPVHEDDIPFYRCKDSDEKVLEFTSMVFGLKSAPFVASSLLDIVSAKLTDLGIAHIRYLDDFLFCSATREGAIESATLASIILRQFGLALSSEKTEGPARRMEFLGIIIDSEDRTLSISAKRKKELIDILSAFSKKTDSTRRSIESLLGKLSFAASVLPGARPFTRRIIDLISGSRRNSKIEIDEGFRLDVEYWLSHISSWNGTQQWRRHSRHPIVFGSDASTEGFAYGLESAPGDVICSLPSHMRPGHVRAGVWSGVGGDSARQQTHRNIAWGEMFCALAAALEFETHLEGQHVVFVIDNESDVNVINRQRSREPRVGGLLRSLCDSAFRYNFSFSAVHRRGEDNSLMDWASRPSLHHFDLRPACAELHVVQERSRLAGLRVAASDSSFSPPVHPPLVCPLNVCLINSRCVDFGTRDGLGQWARSSFGWSRSADPYISPPRRRARTEDRRPSTSIFAGCSTSSRSSSQRSNSAWWRSTSASVTPSSLSPRSCLPSKTCSWRPEWALSPVASPFTRR